MPVGRNRGWRRLDNAAKIFPSTSERSDTRVFRFSVELNEQIEPATLQKALDRSLEFFPLFLCVLRRGAFWYYLEQCDLRPEITEESENPCAVIYEPNRRSLLFNVTYYKNKINFEIYHALTDGTGAIAFLKTLTYYYIRFVHPPEEGAAFPAPPEGSSVSEKAGDSFAKYYRPKNGKREKGEKAFILKGTKIPENAIRITDVRLPVDEILRISKSFGVSMTVFITAVLIKAISETMPVGEKKRPVIINVPVNLRKYFPSETATNFFGLIGVSYDFSSGSGELDDIIKAVGDGFKTELDAEKLEKRMNALSALEHNMAARIAPLPLKNFVLRRARHIADKACTAVVSNVGKIDFPNEFAHYIRNAGVYASTLKLQLCFCSVGNTLSLGFTSAFENTAIERNFIGIITEFGVCPEITSNAYCMQTSERGTK